jgi:hypothetical protein
VGLTLAAGLAVATATAAMAGGASKSGAGAAGKAVAGGAASAVTVGTGQSRALSPNYFGFAFDYGGGSIYPNPGTAGYPAAGDTELAALAPGTVRWPAGTSANYWVWTKGQPVGDPYMTPNPTPDFHSSLSDLQKEYLKTKVPPVFVLNVMTSTLADQEAMLKQAQADGLPIDYVELGNELNLCFNPDYAKYFATGVSYGQQVVGPWTLALHNLFPTIQVAAVAGFEDKTSNCVRDRTWNKDVHTGIQNSGTNGRMPDDYIEHVHPGFDNDVTASNVGTFLAGPDSWPSKVQYPVDGADVDYKLPKPIWITEYSLGLGYSGTNPPQQTYGDALFNSSLGLQLATGTTTTTLVEYWSSFGKENSYAYSADPTQHLPVALTPAGLAMQWVAQAGGGATTVTPLAFTGGPAIGNGSPGLVGVTFTGGGATHEVLLNLSNQPVTLAVGGPVPANTTFHQVAGDPTAQVRAAASLTPTTVTSGGTTGGTLTLPAYSISKM